MRFCVRCLLVLLLVVPCAGRSQAVKDLPRPTDYVSDFAHVLSPQAAQQMDLLCGQVDRKAHAQIAVITVETTNNEPIADYAVELEDAWKVGPKGGDRGVIVLLAVKDHKRFISTGYGVESILPDAKVGDIGRAMVPALEAGNYDAALGGAVGQISQIIVTDAGVTLEQPVRRVRSTQQPQPVQLSLGQLLVGALLLIFLLFVAARTGMLPFLFGMFLGSSFGGRGGGGGRGDDDGGGGSGFDGFGGGSTGGGGAGGDW